MDMIKSIEANLIKQPPSLLNQYDEILVKKARFTLWLNISVAIMVTVIYFASIRRAALDGFSESLISFLPGIILFPTLLMKLGTKYYYIPLSISIISCSGIAMLRILVTGGFYSPNCFLIMIIVYVAATMLSKKFIFLLLTCWSAFLSYLMFAHDHGLVGNPMKNIVMPSTISLILFLVLIQTLSKFHSSIGKKFEKNIGHLEEKLATSELVAAMGHEINTQIFIAEIATEFFMQKQVIDTTKREKFLKKIRSSHQKISTILDSLDQILQEKRTNLAVESFDGSMMIDLGTDNQSSEPDSQGGGI